MKILLISTYELGHQPFGLASPAAWLADVGFDVDTVDLAISKLDAEIVEKADLVGFYLPMHTATRIALPVIKKVKELNPAAHICAFGLYAPMNSAYLNSLGVQTIIGGEFEGEILELAQQLNQNGELTTPSNQENGDINLGKLDFRTPNRAGLPELQQYAYLEMPDGARKIVGYTEATRGCKHLCRHCPIVPVYNGVFRVVQRDVVLDDIRQQVEAGAQHITFGDPDFFNGAGHSLKIVDALHREWPHLTYDVTIKVDHLLKHEQKLATLKQTGCLFVISAVESVDDDILNILDKGHTRSDIVDAVKLSREIGLPLTPTFVAFSPWITLEGYEDLLQTLIDLDLVDSVSPIQLAIRLLIPQGSRLLELPQTHEVIGGFDTASLCHVWKHPDPRVDQLQKAVEAIVETGCELEQSRVAIFSRIWDATQAALGSTPARSIDLNSQSVHNTASLSEPWYCCAEPTKQQLEKFM